MLITNKYMKTISLLLQKLSAKILGVVINKKVPNKPICHELNLFLAIKKKKILPKKETEKIKKFLKKYSELTSVNENNFSNQRAGSSNATPYSGYSIATFLTSLVFREKIFVKKILI